MTKITKEIKKLRSIFKLYPKVKLVYFFGSKAQKESGPLSDYDFAVYLDEKDKKKIFETKLKLLNQISDVLKTDKVDIVVLNTAEAPELKYNIIKYGELIFEKKPFKVLVEPRILNEYFDFRISLLKHDLTKA
ncbi:MAG: nucleotidyltransferase domain-containing protein [Candidatus Paceibacterales bacterium]